MRTLKLHFPDDALPTFDTFLKQTREGGAGDSTPFKTDREVRVFCRAQAVRAIVTEQRLQTVSDTLLFTYAALRKWVHRFDVSTLFRTQSPTGFKARS